MSRHHVDVHQLRGDGGAYLNVLEDAEMGHCGAVGVWGFAADGYPAVILRNADGFFAVISFADAEGRDRWLAPDAAVSFREGYTMTWLAGAPATSQSPTPESEE